MLVSFVLGFRTPAPVQAASSPWAGIRNPQQQRSSNAVYVTSAMTPTAARKQTFRHFSLVPTADLV